MRDRLFVLQVWQKDNQETVKKLDGDRLENTWIPNWLTGGREGFRHNNGRGRSVRGGKRPETKTKTSSLRRSRTFFQTLSNKKEILRCQY